MLFDWKHRIKDKRRIVFGPAFDAAAAHFHQLQNGSTEDDLKVHIQAYCKELKKSIEGIKLVRRCRHPGKHANTNPVPVLTSDSAAGATITTGSYGY